LVFLVVFFVSVETTETVQAVDIEGVSNSFFIDSDYDSQGRGEVSALLRKVTNEAYFYIEEDWYDNLTEGEKEKAISNLETLSEEFSDVIYPGLTENYGEEWNPGIDSDRHITILLHRMSDEAAGYFKTQDELSRLQNSTSNEREMVYLNSHYLLTDIIKSYLAHEFTHLIIFNQKTKIRRQEEEIWFNELRAEYAPVLLGYDDVYPSSNLEKRMNIFLNYQTDSLVEWLNQRADYGVIAAFTNYLVDHYGKEVLTESIKSSKIGIASIQEVLQNLDVKKEFWEIFSDWVVAVFLGDCRKDSKHCYQNENLKYIKISPSLIFLPPNQKTEFFLTNHTTYWAGNWYRLIGGADKLEVIFQGSKEVDFKVPYALCKASYDCSVDFLELTDEEGKFVFENFNEEYTSLTLMPFITSKTSGFNGKEEQFNFSIRTIATPKDTKQDLIRQLKAQIAEIISQIAVLQAELAELLAQEGRCLSITENLHIGVQGGQVECLQEFLTEQGADIYPEAYITGYFGQLTKEAVIRFQQKYAEEILFPLNITEPTGFVGASTRTKINQIFIDFE